MRVLEWNRIVLYVIEVAERKNGMGMDENECIYNIDANENGKQRCVVMRVMEEK